MTRKTIGDLKKVLDWLSETTGKTYTPSPIGGGFWSVGVHHKDGSIHEIANRKLADMIDFLEAYRRGYAAALHDLTN